MRCAEECMQRHRGCARHSCDRPKGRTDVIFDGGRANLVTSTAPALGDLVTRFHILCRCRRNRKDREQKNCQQSVSSVHRKDLNVTATRNAPNGAADSWPRRRISILAGRAMAIGARHDQVAKFSFEKSVQTSWPLSLQACRGIADFHTTTSRAFFSNDRASDAARRAFCKCHTGGKNIRIVTPVPAWLKSDL
jgi:hypothetical protein